MPQVIEHEEEHLDDGYGILVPTSKYPPLRRLKRKHEPSAHGNKTWGSSFPLMDFLLHYPPRKRAKILEVGCGWGPAGVFCAKAFRARVTGLDIDPEVFPFLDLMCELNAVEIARRTGGFQDLKKRDLAAFDTIIGSDICFWDKLVKELGNMIERALDAGVKRVIVADPGRPTFTRMCKRLGKVVDVEVYDWYSMDPDYNQADIAVFQSR
ncbi:MAG: methyltransferase domain-containing protein [Pseudomonadota bacterium]